jgi:chromosome segregation ATPase
MAALSRDVGGKADRLPRDRQELGELQAEHADAVRKNAQVEGRVAGLDEQIARIEGEIQARQEAIEALATHAEMARGLGLKEKREEVEALRASVRDVEREIPRLDLALHQALRRQQGSRAAATTIRTARASHRGGAGRDLARRASPLASPTLDPALSMTPPACRPHDFASSASILADPP